MIIKKGECEYTVIELAKDWKVTRTVGGVEVEYRISKAIAPDAAAVKEYIRDNNEVFGGIV